MDTHTNWQLQLQSRTWQHSRAGIRWCSHTTSLNVFPRCKSSHVVSSAAFISALLCRASSPLPHLLIQLAAPAAVIYMCMNWTEKKIPLAACDRELAAEGPWRRPKWRWLPPSSGGLCGRRPANTYTHTTHVLGDKPLRRNKQIMFPGRDETVTFYRWCRKLSPHVRSNFPLSFITPGRDVPKDGVSCCQIWLLWGVC